MAVEPADERRRRLRYELLLGSGVLLLATCLACPVGAVAVNWYATSMSPSGMSVLLCAGVTTTPRLQAGVSWVSPLSGYIPPLITSPLAICAHVPATWIAYYPRSYTGQWMIPP
jgi:hypothetical protein